MHRGPARFVSDSRHGTQVACPRHLCLWASRLQSHVTELPPFRRLCPQRNRLVALTRLRLQVVRRASGVARILAEGAIGPSVTLSGGALFANGKLFQFLSSLIVKVILVIFMWASAQRRETISTCIRRQLTLQAVPENESLLIYHALSSLSLSLFMFLLSYYLPGTFDCSDRRERKHSNSTECPKFRLSAQSRVSQPTLVNLPGWCWAEIQQFAHVGSSSSLHSEPVAP